MYQCNLDLKCVNTAGVAAGACGVVGRVKTQTHT